MYRRLITFLVFILSVLAILQLVSLPAVSPPAPPEVLTGVAAPTEARDQTQVVARVIDGDTIELTSGARVRYIGVNTPETVDPRQEVECFGREAAAENKRLVAGREVSLEKDVSEVDQYGRLLRYVYVDNLMVNDYLVRQGFGQAATYPPDVKYAQRFRLAQEEARDAGRGFWVSCPPE